MKYTQKLTKIGNSTGLIIPKQVLRDMDINAGENVYMELVNNKLLVEKNDSEEISPEFLKIAESVEKRYRKDFEDLAKL